MTKMADLTEEWMKDPDFRAEYEALAPEFDLVGQLIGARTAAGLSRAEVALRMRTSIGVVVGLESGRRRPSLWDAPRFVDTFAMRPARLRVT
jgi:hypothetical protein